MSKSGRTRLISATVKGDVVRVVCLGRMRRDEADWQALKRSLHEVGTNFAAITEGGEIWNWYGQTPAFPEPNTDGYFHKWPADDLAQRIKAARRAGTLRLDSVIKEGDTTSGILPIRTRVIGPGQWEIESSTAAAASLAEFRSLPQLVDVVRVATLLDRLDRRTLEKAFGKISRAPMERETAQFRAGLNALAPQRVAAALLDGGDVAAAWILPSELHSYNYSASALRYQLFTIARDGSIFLRPILDSNDCVLLRLAVKVPDCDLAMRSRISPDVARFVKPSKDRHGYFDAWHVNDEPWSARREPSREEACLNATLHKVADEIYEHLSVDLRDEFQGVDDYNLLHARGDSGKASARKQASTTVFGGLGLLLANTKPGKELLDTVDARFRLHRAAARVLNVPTWVVRRLTTSSHDVLERLSNTVCSDVSRALHWLGPQVRVRTHFDVQRVAELLSFTQCQRHYGGVSLPGSNLAIAQLLLSLVGRTVSKYGFENAATIVRSASLSGTASNEIVDYLRFAHSCFDAVVEERLPRGLFLGGLDTKMVRAMQLAFADATLEDIARWSVRYHDLIATTVLPRSEANQQQTYPQAPAVLPPSVLAQTGWRVEQLRDQAALEMEGRVMRHCVAAYAHRVASAATAIFSLVGAEDRMTVEVSQSQYGGWRMLQARRTGNKAVLPGTPAHIALDEFLALLESRAEPLRPRTKRAGSVADDLLEGRFDRHGFAHRLVDAYGINGWTRLRGALPGSAHGRIETKLWECFLSANPSVRKRVDRNPGIDELLRAG